ncbi:hypothetical protein HYFRA_00011811 [Hymenoscyphus fraxineus]|uniref:Alpha box domain-containing protein n=1 Tax=Hymenoscyphus fraxineus TaxID=746836 RepID=A0A9N9L694_9HELO|nr:hypothetical protein HYFRA_00011811 [Hymenoscyphus fraxineus]
MALMFSLDSHIPGQKEPTASRRLEQTPESTSEYLIHNIPRKKARRTIATLQQHQSRLLQSQLDNTNRFVTTAPKPLKRGVNSFMAFRAFYSRIFAAFQQKNSSTLIKLLWDEDPFRAKWSILARAYTSIRDHVGKENAPIGVFLETVYPQIGIIGVDVYLTKMNWVIGRAEDGSISLHQHSCPDFDTFSAHIMNTPMTEKDVTYYCAFRGYITPQASFQIAGPILQGGSSTTTTPQQGLLATAPVISFNTPVPPTKYVQNAREIPALAAASLFSFDFESTASVTPLREDYEWGSNSFDLYRPNEGIFDFESQFTQPNNSAWDTFSIENPQELHDFLENGGLHDEYFSPDALERSENANT